MNENHFDTYAAEIRAEFGLEWSPLGHKAAKAHVAKLHEAALRWSKNVMHSKGIYEKNKTAENEREYLEDLEKSDAAIGEYYKARDLLDTGEIYGTMAPVEHTNYIACDSEISLADLYDIRHDTNGKAPRIVAERYDDTATASATDEGNTIDKKINFADCVNTFTADYDAITKLDSIEVIPEDYIMDDPELGHVAFNNLRFKHLRSAENALLCQEIIGSKAAVSLSTAADLLTLPALSAKARRGAEIITNETGFARLDDCDSVGEPYIKKNFQIGEFVYRDRYIIRVLPDEILANYENDTAPVLLGDWKNILRLAVVTARAAEHTDIVAFTVEARTIRREVPILTTTSDKAYFVGAIA